MNLPIPIWSAIASQMCETIVLASLMKLIDIHFLTYSVLFCYILYKILHNDIVFELI